jgi:transposase
MEGAEDSRHASSGENARRLFGRGAAKPGEAVEGREPEPAAVVIGGGSRRDGSRRGGQDRRHGPPDLARLGPPLQRSGPEGLFDHWTEGPKPRLSPEQLAEFAAIVETGPNRKVDGVARWRRIDLKRVIVEKFGVDYHQRYIGKLLKKLGFSHISARPRHPAQDERIVAAFKKTSRAP